MFDDLFTGPDTGCPAPVWDPTQAAARARLAAFASRAGKAYAGTRNYDYGQEHRGNTSILSPWIRHRLLLEQEVLEAVLTRHTFAASEKFVQEVFWRGYFKGWLEHRPRVWRDYVDAVEAQVDRLSRDAAFESRYTEAVSGRTGIACFDAWAAELVETGYLHNHTRMWFASIWIFTLRLPWQLGADFFLRHLLDGDPASNTLSWRWVGGLHTKGKTYLARPANIARYTEGRFNPEGELAQTAPPLEEAASYPLGPLPTGMTEGGGGRYGLLLTEEDCHPASLPLREAPSSLAGLSPLGRGSPLEVGAPAAVFSGLALRNALADASTHWSLPENDIDPDRFVEGLVSWAERDGISTIVTAYAPVGPVADLLNVSEPALARHGLSLQRVQRRYDALVWPHATKGFFGLKAKLPHVLAGLGF